MQQQAVYPSSRPPSQAGGRQRPGRGQGGASSAPSAPPFLELGPAPELDFGQGPGYQGRVVMGTTAFTAIAGSIKQVSSVGGPSPGGKRLLALIHLRHY